MCVYIYIYIYIHTFIFIYTYTYRSDVQVDIDGSGKITWDKFLEYLRNEDLQQKKSIINDNNTNN